MFLYKHHYSGRVIVTSQESWAKLTLKQQTKPAVFQHLLLSLITKHFFTAIVHDSCWSLKQTSFSFCVSCLNSIELFPVLFGNYTLHFCTLYLLLLLLVFFPLCQKGIFDFYLLLNMIVLIHYPNEHQKPRAEESQLKTIKEDKKQTAMRPNEKKTWMTVFGGMLEWRGGRRPKRRNGNKVW